MTTSSTVHDELELDGIWFLSTFLFFGYGIGDERNPLDVGQISFVPTSPTEGFSQVVVELENGDKYRVEVEKVQ